MQAITIIENWLLAQIADIVDDLWSIQLAIIGIAVSVMTLLFTSHVGKVEAFRHICKSKDTNNELMSIYLSNGIRIYRQLNSKIVSVFTISCILFLYSSVVKYISNKTMVFWTGFADLFLTIALVVWTAYVIKNVVWQYKIEIK